MAAREADQSRVQAQQDGEFFLDTPVTPDITVHQVEDLLQPFPLQFEEPRGEVYTPDGRPLLARMVVRDKEGRRADIQVVATGQNGEPAGFVLDASLRGMPNKGMSLLLSDARGHQFESVTEGDLHQVRISNGEKRYDVAMREVQWEIAGRPRDGQGPAGLFLGSHQRFQGGSLAIQRPS